MRKKKILISEIDKQVRILVENDLVEKQNVKGLT
jgi:hypothetical protein